MRFAIDLGDGVSLALRTLDTAENMHRLTVRNLDRLRAWEPTVIFCGDEAVGSASLRMDRSLGIGEIGYWVDRDAEGKGIAFRSCSALIRHAADEGMRRLEIRTASANIRSCRLAERLGFEHEVVLKNTLPIGDARLDVAIYGLVLAP